MAHQLVIGIRADGSQARSELGQVEQRIKGLTNETAAVEKAMKGSMASIGQVVGAVSGAIAAAGIGRWASEVTTAFAETEAASRTLEQALIAQGTAVPGLTEHYADLAAEFQRTTAFSDDLITEMQALLVQVGGVMPGDMRRALQAATDLSAGLGVDLRTATMLVGKAFVGEADMLKRYGIVIDETKLKTQGVTAVLDGINAKFGGQAQAQLDTYSGKMERLSNVMNDAQEQFGAFVARALDPLIDAFVALPGPVQGAAAAFVALAPLLGSLGVAALGLKAALPLLGVEAAALSGVLLKVGAAAAVVATAFASWQVGRWIGETFGLTDAVGKLAARFGEFVGLLPEGAAAQYDAMRAAQRSTEAHRAAVPPVADLEAVLKKLTPRIEGVTDAQKKQQQAAGEAAKKWAAWTESVREASFAVQNFLSKQLLLAPTLEANNASLEAGVLIANHSVAVAGEQAQATRQTNLELARAGMLLDFTAHTSNNASQEARAYTRETQALGGMWAGTGERIRDAIGHVQTAVNGSFAQMLIGAKSFKAGFLDIWQSLKAGVMNILNSILSSFVNSFLKGMMNAMSGGSFSQAFAGMVPGLGGLLGGGGAAGGLGAFGVPGGLAMGMPAPAGMAAGGGFMGSMGALMTNPWTIGIAGAAALGTLIWKKGLFRGGEEALKVNPQRDIDLGALQQQFGGATHYYAMVNALGSVGITGPRASSLIEGVSRADTMKEYEAGLAAFQQAMATAADSTQAAAQTTSEAAELTRMSIAQLQAQAASLEGSISTEVFTDLQAAITALQGTDSAPAVQLITAELAKLKASGTITDDAILDVTGRLTQLRRETVPLEGQLIDTRFAANQTGAAIGDLGAALGDFTERALASAAALSDARPAVSEASALPAPVNEAPIEGFATGTMGRFVNFGAGQLAVLHNQEAVVRPGDPVPIVGGPRGRDGDVHLSVVVNGAPGQSPQDIADEVAHRLTDLYRRNTRGLRSQTRFALGIR